MPDTVQDLTKKLLRAIDSEGNVQDMGAVREVVSCLEQAQVTAEDLKATRLGKHVNTVRRKLAATNRKLAKRMKNLVKQWQGLVPNRTPNGLAANASSMPTASLPPLPTPSTSSLPTPSIPSPSTSSLPSPSTSSLPTPSTSSLPTPSTSSLPTPSTSSTSLPARVTQHPTRSRTQVQQLLSTVKRGPQQPPSAAQQAAAATVAQTNTLSNSTSHPPPPPDSSKPSPPSSDSLSKSDFPTLTLSFPLNSYRQPSAPEGVNSLVVRLPRQQLSLPNSVTGPRGSSWRGKRAADTTQPLCLLVSIDTSLLPGNNSQAVNRTAPLSLELDSQTLTPVDVVPGVDGCLGRDGVWYDWTRHIPSQDFSVTVLPYVYIDGLET